jgi:hypothetical protein
MINFDNTPLNPIANNPCPYGVCNMTAASVGGVWADFLWTKNDIQGWERIPTTVTVGSGVEQRTTSFIAVNGEVGNGSPYSIHTHGNFGTYDLEVKLPGCAVIRTEQATLTINASTDDILGLKHLLEGEQNICATAIQNPYTFKIPYLYGVDYAWTLPSGWTVHTSQYNEGGFRAIKVNVTSTGTIRVTASRSSSNTCAAAGTSTIAELTVVVGSKPWTGPLPSPGIGFGLTCAALENGIQITLNAPTPGAISHIWTALTPGWTFTYINNNTTGNAGIIAYPTLGAATTGEFEVKAVNDCGGVSDAVVARAFFRATDCTPIQNPTERYRVHQGDYAAYLGGTSTFAQDYHWLADAVEYCKLNNTTGAKWTIVLTGSGSPGSSTYDDVDMTKQSSIYSNLFVHSTPSTGPGANNAIIIAPGLDITLTSDNTTTPRTIKMLGNARHLEVASGSPWEPALR